MKRGSAWAALAVGLLAAGPARAAGDGPATVYCGAVQCVTLRTIAHGQSPEQRADWAMNLLNKYLGGRQAQFSVVPRGREAQIVLNGEVLLAVSPADARADGVKSVATLARRWRNALSKAFAATRAQK